MLAEVLLASSNAAHGGDGGKLRRRRARPVARRRAGDREGAALPRPRRRGDARRDVPDARGVCDDPDAVLGRSRAAPHLSTIDSAALTTPPPRSRTLHRRLRAVHRLDLLAAPPPRHARLASTTRSSIRPERDLARRRRRPRAVGAAYFADDAAAAAAAADARPPPSSPVTPSRSAAIRTPASETRLRRPRAHARGCACRRRSPAPPAAASRCARSRRRRRWKTWSSYATPSPPERRARHARGGDDGGRRRPVGGAVGARLGHSVGRGERGDARRARRLPDRQPRRRRLVGPRGGHGVSSRIRLLSSQLRDGGSKDGESKPQHHLPIVAAAEAFATCLCQQASEKIDRMRVCAAAAAARLLLAPDAPPLADAEALSAGVPRPMPAAADGTAANGAAPSVVPEEKQFLVPTSAFPRVVALLALPARREATMRGLVVSAGGKTESTMRAARAALQKHCARRPTSRRWAPRCSASSTRASPLPTRTSVWPSPRC